MNLKKIVGDLFEIGYRHFTNNYAFEFDPEMNKQGVSIDNFIKLLNEKYGEESIGINFLVSYFEFQFEYWMDKATQRRISLNWIIGKKAFQRWIDIDDDELSNYFACKNVGNVFVKYKEKHTLAIDYNTETSFEKKEKLKYYNTEEGFINCIRTTTLFCKSITCFQCRFKKDCKAILKKQFPNIYERRFNG